MLSDTLQIRKLKRADIPVIKELTPPEWNSDLGIEYPKHYGQDYFHPFVATIDGEIAGTGLATIHNNVSWLGNIIVRESYRNKGIGNAITTHLVDFSKSKGIDSILLFATELGLPVYRKIGFQYDSSYLFFKSDNPIKIDSLSRNISPIVNSDYARILELDYRITGEKREKLLTPALKTGFKFQAEKLEGIYLPDFGKGLILSDTETAGIELLKYRLSQDNSPVCIPGTNTAATHLFRLLGLYEYKRSPRLFFNRDINWDPQKIYSRGSGYFG